MRQGMQQVSLFPKNEKPQEVEQNRPQAVAMIDELPGSRASSKPPVVANRVLVIPAETKRSKKAPTSEILVRRLKLRTRYIIVMLIILLALGGTLVTLVPLASGQGAWNLTSRLGSLLQSARTNLQSLDAQNNIQPTVSTSSTNNTANANSSSGLPPMTIPRSQLVVLAEQDATNAGISPVYFVRQITLESGFNPYAVSPGGAEGIAQFEPGTAAGLGINPFNPTQALQAAAQMMARYAKQYGGYAKALAAYNAGSGSLQNAENACGANWLSCMPVETQHYVATIMGV